MSVVRSSVEGIDLVKRNLALATAETLLEVKGVIERTLNKAVEHATAGHGPDAHDSDRFVTRSGSAGLIGAIHPNEVKIIPGVKVEGSFSASREYAEFVEKGTSRSAPYAYMWPAALAVAPAFKREIDHVLYRGKGVRALGK